MKLALRDQEDVAVLSASGELTARDLDVLRAGITKLLRSGKHRIVLELPDTEKLPPELIRELSKFDLLARELSGRVLLACLLAPLQKQVKQFANPPTVQFFDSLNAAIQHMRGDPSPKATPADAASEKSITATQSRDLELGELGQLRKRVATLENENEQLRNHLHAALGTQAVQASESAQKRETDALRLRIDELLEQVKAEQS